MTSIADPPIRRLDHNDVAACVALAQERGWSPEPRKWALLMDCGEVYGAGDDELLGTVALVRYGPELTVVAMMIVARAHGRKGIGRRLMTHVLRKAGQSTVALYATNQGRPMYLGLGFRTVGRSASYTGTLPGGGSGGSRVATAADLAGIALADRVAFGADRGRLLRAWLGEHHWLRVVERDERIAGYAGAWRSIDDQVLLGPVVADDLATATGLITDLAADAGGRIRVDVDPATPGLEAWLIEQGLLARGPAFPLMTLDGTALPGERARIFAPAGSALG